MLRKQVMNLLLSHCQLLFTFVSILKINTEYITKAKSSINSLSHFYVKTVTSIITSAIAANTVVNNRYVNIEVGLKLSSIISSENKAMIKNTAIVNKNIFVFLMKPSI